MAPPPGQKDGLRLRRLETDRVVLGPSQALFSTPLGLSKVWAFVRGLTPLPQYSTGF